DWKLPNIKELQSIVDYSRSNPSIRLLYFPNTKSSSYYLSTVGAYNSDSAGIVVFDKGTVGSGLSRGGVRYVRCVRHGQ
ncbi:DUF1566 domain-containing protein, partial [Deltaproteobacteria bacterium TL4]